MGREESAKTMTHGRVNVVVEVGSDVNSTKVDLPNTLLGAHCVHEVRSKMAAQSME